MRQGKQPPFYEYEPAREGLRVLDVEAGWIVGNVLERERRVLVGAQCAVAVEADAPGPAQDAEVEVEEPPRIAPGEEDREEGGHADNREGDEEEEEDDEVRNGQQPLDEPEPAAEPRRELARELKRICGCALHRDLSVAISTTG